MKIKAIVHDLMEVTIIDFAVINANGIKAIYVDWKGNLSSCYIDSIKILDKDYIPAKT